MLAKPVVGGNDLSSPYTFYFLCLVILVICILLTMNLLRSPMGRAMTAVMMTAAEGPRTERLKGRIAPSRFG